jgi:hypothetical protein
VRALAAVVLVAALGIACKEKELPKEGLGQRTAEITADTSVLRDAQGAVNEVLRNAGDCDAARPHIAVARTKLSEAGAKIQTIAGRTTLDALQKQLNDVAQNCP